MCYIVVWGVLKFVRGVLGVSCLWSTYESVVWGVLKLSEEYF